jgi:hypothetical protein
MLELLCSVVQIRGTLLLHLEICQNRVTQYGGSEVPARDM